MVFIEKMELMMKEKGISSKAELAKTAGLPYTTIDGLYKKGADNIKRTTLIALCSALDCSLDYLGNDNVTERGHFAVHRQIDKAETPKPADEMTEAELDEEIIAIFLAMSPDERERAKVMLRAAFPKIAELEAQGLLPSPLDRFEPEKQ